MFVVFLGFSFMFFTIIVRSILQLYLINQSIIKYFFSVLEITLFSNFEESTESYSFVDYRLTQFIKEKFSALATFQSQRTLRQISMNAKENISNSVWGF